MICATRDIENTDIPNRYPAICKHLGEYRGIGKLGDNSTTKVFNRPWWSLMQEPTGYWEDFSKQKIVWGEISDKAKFCLDLSGEYINEATTFLMVGNDLLYLVSYLNSKLSQYIFSKLGTTTGVGTVRWKKFTIEQLLVPEVSLEIKYEFERQTLIILEMIKTNQDYMKLSKSIDNIIYKVFNFSKQEIEFIDCQ